MRSLICAVALGFSIAVALFTVAPPIAAATSIEYSFTGTITNVIDLGSNQPTTFGYFTVGASFNGRLKFDSSAAIIEQSVGYAKYRHPVPSSPFGLSVEINGATYSSNPTLPFDIVVTNDLVCCDIFSVLTLKPVLSLASGPVVPDSLRVSMMQFYLRDESRNSQSSLALPVDLDLADYDYPGTGFDWLLYTDDPAGGQVHGVFNSLVLVPEPGTALLVGLGLAGLATRSSRPRDS